MHHGPDALQEVNLAFQKLLCLPEPAELPPAHGGDRLMVWFLLGGKDVGKSTLLDALLGTESTRLSSETVAGTQRFLAYIHESALPELERRMEGLSVEIQFSLHARHDHRHLCLIDSPDFDSRFERHAMQVGQILSSGAADGVVLMASPEKYKNTEYWSAFRALSPTLTSHHILFVLNKADELGGYLEEAREDFTRTVQKRVPTVPDPEGASWHPDVVAPAVYLVNARERKIDFHRLEQRLMRPLTRADVASAQQDNLRHARRTGAERIRKHYRLGEVRVLLHAASAAERVDDLFEDAFPEAFFQSVSSRMNADRGLAATLRERIWTLHGGALAGTAALHAAVQWLSARNPFRWRSGDGDPAQRRDGSDLHAWTRWGHEDLDRRLDACRRATLAGLLPDAEACMEPFLSAERSVVETLANRLEDLLALPVGRPISRVVRWAVNLPVYLYLLFFLFLLFSPVFLLLKAWGVRYAPDLAGVLNLDNVKVAVLGFAGTYLMAFLYVVRKQRDRVRRELAVLARRFILEMKVVLREELERPPARLVEAFSLLEERLESAVLAPPQGESGSTNDTA